MFQSSNGKAIDLVRSTQPGLVNRISTARIYLPVNVFAA